MDLQEAQAICYMFDRPIRELKEQGADAYGIPGARFLLRNCWSDVYTWIDGYVINDNDIADEIRYIMQEEYGEERAAKIETNEEEYNKFIENHKIDIYEYVVYEGGEKMSLEEAYRKYKAWY